MQEVLVNDSFELFVEEVSTCTACPLADTRKSVVIYRGAPSAPLAFVGEAPGANEDKKGVPFIGASGDELDAQIVNASKLVVPDYGVFNVIKCRPPGNKFPGDPGSVVGTEAVYKCLPWLDRQLALMGPKATVLVGAKAVKWLLYRDGGGPPALKTMLDGRYRHESWPGIDFLVMYHPAYLFRLRNADLEQAAWVEKKTRKAIKTAIRIALGKKVKVEPTLLRSKKKKAKQRTLFEL